MRLGRAFCRVQLDHLKAEVKEIEPKVKQLEKSNTKLQTQLDDVTKALEAAKVGGRAPPAVDRKRFSPTNTSMPCFGLGRTQAKLAKLDFDQAKHEDLARQKAAAEQAVAALREVSTLWCAAPVGPARSAHQFLPLSPIRPRLAPARGRAL